MPFSNDPSSHVAVPGQRYSPYLQALGERAKAGDPQATAELLRLAHADQQGTGHTSGQSTETQRAREAANEYLGTNLPPLDRQGGFLNDFVSNDLGPLLEIGAGTAIAAPVLGAVAGGGAAAGSGTAAGVGGTAAATKGVLGTVEKYGPLVLGGLGALDAHNQYAEADKLRRQAVDRATADYATRAPLREEAIRRATLGQPVREDLSSLYASPNPFSRPIPRPASPLGTPVPAPAPVGPPNDKTRKPRL